MKFVSGMNADAYGDELLKALTNLGLSTEDGDRGPTVIVANYAICTIIGELEEGKTTLIWDTTLTDKLTDIPMDGLEPAELAAKIAAELKKLDD